MPAYVLAEIEITNPDGYKEYTTTVPATIAQYGGRFLVRGGAIEVLEGDWPQRRRGIIQFESMAAAKRWWDSSEEAKPQANRRANKKRRPARLGGRLQPLA